MGANQEGATSQSEDDQELEVTSEDRPGVTAVNDSNSMTNQRQDFYGQKNND